MRVYFLTISILLMLVFIWGIFYNTAPKIDVTLIDAKDKTSDEKWNENVGNGLRQIELTFKIINKHEKGIPLYGIYSPRLNSLSIEARHINSDIQRRIASKE